MTRPIIHGRPTRTTLAARRDLLLATALDLFTEHGYASSSLAAIAGAAHVAVRTIYVKFGGKAGLLASLIEEEHYRHRQQLLAVPFTENLVSQLELMARHLVSRIQDERLMRLHAVIMKEGDEPARTAWRDAGPCQLATQLIPLFRLPEAKILFDPFLTPEELCVHFLNCITGLSNNGYQMQSLHADAQAQRGLRLFLRGVIGY
ncbi:TetR family transcriptional regulator [Duganella sp. LjRoot269]|uniref:TetR family transcriptional regulator n=1 Tax=Duganella sp. LjRoot269 TaxID=3342305 RepID=UPI003ECD9E83